MKLSACVRVRDRADLLGPCLDSLAFCDEVVVTEVGTTQGTSDRVLAHGARFVATGGLETNEAARHLIHAARHEWVLCLDADERVDGALQAAILEATARPLDAAGEPAGYEIRRVCRYLGRSLRHGSRPPDWCLRLYDRRQARWGGAGPRGAIAVRGEVRRLRRGSLLHVACPSLSDHVGRINATTTRAAEALLRRGRRPAALAMVVRPPVKVLSAYVGRLGFLDGVPGLFAAVMEGWSVFLTHAKAYAEARGLSRPDHRPLASAGPGSPLPAARGVAVDACLGEGTDFTRDVGRGRGARRRELGQDRLDQLLAAHDEALERRDHRVAKVGRKSRITRHGDAVVKESLSLGVGGRVKDALAPDRHGAGYRNAHHLELLAVATARPLAWVERGGRSYTLYEDLSALVRFDRHVRRVYRTGTRAEQDRLREASAAWVRGLHRRGIYHGDLKGVNVLVADDAEGLRFPLIDTDRLRVFPGEVDRRRVVKNLAQLAASIPVVVSRTERLRWFRRYADGGPLAGDERGAAREVAAALAAKTVVVDEPIE